MRLRRLSTLLHRQVAEAPVEEAEASAAEVKEVKNEHLDTSSVLGEENRTTSPPPPPHSSSFLTNQEIADNLADDFVVTETAEAVEVAIAESVIQPVRDAPLLDQLKAV